MRGVDRCDIKTISAKLKQRFCTDNNLPINIFQEPYFFDRLKLYQKYYDTLRKWGRFVIELDKYNCEQDYFEDYNRVKDEAINFIKSTESYKNFLKNDINQFKPVHTGLPHKDIFHAANDKRAFISIDMKHANFSALRFYDAKIFDNAETWEEFIRKFTDNQHIIDSKYIRQVILGNCDPKRHITYEKYLMDSVLGFTTKNFFPIDKIVFFSNDEIIFDVTDEDYADNKYARVLQGHLNDTIRIPLKVEYFILHKIEGTHGYYKEIIKPNGETEIKFKCLDSLYMPFVIRKFLGQEIQENDKVFYHNGLLAKFIETPEIEVN